MALLSAANVPSATASIAAPTNMASVPLASFGALNSILPSTLPSVTVVSVVCSSSVAPSASGA